MKNNRYLGAVIIAPLLVFLFIGGVYLRYLVLVLSLCGMYEFFKVVKEKSIHPISIFAYILCLIYYVTLKPKNSFELLMLLLIAAIFMLLCLIVFLNSDYNFVDVSITILGFLYVGVFFSFIVLVNLKQFGNFLVWIIFISSWMGDTAAYYVGSKFGKHKLSPHVSQKKTIEGAIGGILGATIACGVYGLFARYYNVNIEIYHFLIMGALGGVVGLIGDLAASAIKRYVGVKDYSNLIPGHGGILDRFDSILFVSVVVYYYITIIMGM